MFFRGGSQQPESLTRELQIELCLKVQSERDQEAMERLCKAFWLAVVGRIAGRIPDKRNAEDYAQEVFVQACDDLTGSEYDGESTFYALLCRTIQRVLKEKKKGDEKTDRKTRVKTKTFLSTDLTRPSDHGQTKDFMDSLPHPGTSQEPESDDEIAAEEDEIVWLELLRLLFLCCAKPHQVLAFGFTQLLEWTPRDFVERRSDATLEQLGDEFCKTYFETCNAFYDETCDVPFLGHDDFFDTTCSPLKAKLDSPVRTIYSEWPYRRLNPGVVKERRFSEFYTAECAVNREKCIHNWSHKVKLKARKVKKTGKICARKQSTLTVPLHDGLPPAATSGRLRSKRTDR